MSRAESVDNMFADYQETVVPADMPPEVLLWIRASYFAGASASLRVLAERAAQHKGNGMAQVAPLCGEILATMQAMGGRVQ